MIKVITYGTFDLLHYGHIRLLERARALGDYLIVGVTADDFDKSRGKLNVRQSLIERVEAVRGTGLADEIVVEEYEGQKIDDIRRYGVDIFAIGSDWKGQFDYLSEYCRVVYLDRTEGVSSSQLRGDSAPLRLGLVGLPDNLTKFVRECACVNGVRAAGICTDDPGSAKKQFDGLALYTSDYDELLAASDAVYIISHPSTHSELIRRSLAKGRHVLCESPLTLDPDECNALFAMAKEKGLVLTEALKTAYSTAYSRLLLLVKSGRIGSVISVDATCTSLKDLSSAAPGTWNSICAWGPTALLPVFQLLGTEYRAKHISTMFADRSKALDLFTKIDFVYDSAVASIKVGKGIKSEGELIISGTKGYIYVPAPWWKTDYFEIRYEEQNENRRYFYPLEGEGIRYEIAAFAGSVSTGSNYERIEKSVSSAIAGIMKDFGNGTDTCILSPSSDRGGSTCPYGAGTDLPSGTKQ